MFGGRWYVTIDDLLYAFNHADPKRWHYELSKQQTTTE